MGGLARANYLRKPRPLSFRKFCIDKPAARGTFHIMKEFRDMKNYTTRVIRVNPEIHRELKVMAAEQGVAISELATDALERELRRRQVKPEGGKT